MHDIMMYGLIQGQSQGHEPLKVGNLAIFEGCLLPHLQWGLANYHVFLNYGTRQDLKLIGAGFFNLFLF